MSAAGDRAASGETRLGAVFTERSHGGDRFETAGYKKDKSREPERHRHEHVYALRPKAAPVLTRVYVCKHRLPKDEDGRGGGGGACEPPATQFSSGAEEYGRA